MKYVIVQPTGIDFEFAITFPEIIQHCQAVDRRQVKAVAAGFFKRCEDGTINVWGESNSLKLKSRGQEDAAIISFSEAMPSIEPDPQETVELTQSVLRGNTIER